jgi:hypothetical protein
MFTQILEQFRNHHELITDLNQVTPTWLTGTLGKNGYLPRGKVVGVKREFWKNTELSIIVRLTVNYSSDALPSLPSRLLLKYSKPNVSSKRASLLSQKENEFYAVVARAMTNPQAPKCYDGFYSPELGKSHLLLEDLSETHAQPKHPLPPSKYQAEQDVDCLAAFHAYWWNDPRLGQSVGRIPTYERLQKRARTLSRGVTNFMDFLGDRLSTERRKIYENILAFLPELQQRMGRNLTLTHGDAHCWNFLNPINPDKDTTRIIDWEFWNVDVGTNDLAYMVAVHWYSEMRASFEKELVKRYYGTLASNGIENYEWEDCWIGYRLSVVRNVFTPVLQWANGLNARIWWHNLERIMSAFSDLDCAELLEK